MPRLTISALQRPSDSSPSKRRKTRGNTLKSKKTMHESSWPMGDKKLPVEVYINIIKYLSRKSVEDMRLVCKEMEEKVSGALFDQVVVPFKPEIYGITPEPSLSSTQHEALMAEMGHGSVMLQDKGMRVFQGFGAHIKKFALSFEFEEDKLARPPIKSDQEAITSFWGIYRWPFKAYNRYSQLEGLEQTADETRTMSQALRHMTNSTELGLSVDGGLGWLAGPDINSRVADRDEKNPVFGASKKMLPDLTTKSERMRRANAMDNLGGVSSDGASTQEWTSVERMLREAGYEEGEELDRSVEILLDHDRSALALPRHHNHDSPPASQSSTISVLSRGRPRLRPDTRFEALQLVTRNTHGTVHNPNGMVSYSEDEEEEGSTMPTECAVKVVAGKADASTLKPNDLNNAQREMLLEMEWAQRAFMQSYAIAIMDSHPTFENVTTFTIARLPSRHLPIIHRSDFWDSLPQLKKLSIAIIPDWREVVKLPTSWVQDNKVAPSQSVPGVYHFLKDQIAERKNIKSLHFEWLCGGEEAPGIFSRNQNIVAAPLVPKANDMVNRRHQPPASVLDLSYVQHLSLKNCWVSPHILEEFGSALKKGELQTLKLESVSLSAPVATNGQPNPLNGHPANNQAAQNAQAQAVAQIGVANGFPALAHLNAPNAHHAFHIHQAQPQPQPHPPQQPVPQVVSDWLDQPRNGSWAQIIETLTPGVTLADIRYSRDLAPEPPSRERTHLRRVEFKSCGYVRLPLDFVQTMLDPPDVPAALPTAITKRMGDLEGVMMKHGDYYLGIIINHIHPTEAQVLENAWNMNIGWGRERAELAADSAVDGIRAAGHGRFTGVIEPNPRSTSRTPPFSLS